MQDFTLTTYKKLLQELLANGYSFQTLQDFIQQPEDKTVILRHDVDRLAENALVIAKIEKEAGGRRSEVRGQRSEVRNQTTEKRDGWMNGWLDDGQEAEVGERTDVGGQRREQGNASLSPGMIRMNRMTGWKKTGFRDLRFRTTWDIIKAAKRGLLPDKIMLNTHPQRWDDKPWPWVKELVWQNVKNVVKRWVIKFRD